MNTHLERKLAVNRWVIRARWFYVSGIFVIGVITKITGQANVSFSYASMALLAVFILVVNVIFGLMITRLSHRNGGNGKFINIIGAAQIATELLVLTMVMHKAGGIDSIAIVYYFLPIVSASLLFGLSGSVITALLSGSLVCGLVAAEHFGIVGHINRYGTETLEFRNFPLSLIKTVTISLFYVIIGAFSGVGARLLYSREEQFMRISREADGSAVKLRQKIKELEKAQQDTLRAFADLKQERVISDSEKKRTRAVLSNLVDPIILIDKNNVINFINPAAAEVLGMDSNTLSQPIKPDNHYSLNNFKDIIRFEYTANVSKTNEAERNITEEMEINRAGQAMTYKVMTVDVMDDDGQFLGVMKIFYNLTREKIIDRLKSEFISIAAHQLRTPLSAIKWAIKMVLDGDMGKLNSEQERILFKGYISNERIIKLVNDMLDVSRIEEGRFNYEYSKTDFSEPLEIAIGHLERRLEKKHIKFTVNMPKQLPLIHMDAEKIALVIENLLENAIEYTPEKGQITIKIEKGDALLRFCIKDTGVGIPETDQERIFSKFYRASNVIRMQTDGSGLGLFIVKNIIKNHGGEITYSSEEGEGTEFVFTLPINNS